MAQRPTMHDVAARAGVSQAVVSIVLSGRYAGRASEATAERIRHAANSLGYRTNLQAKTLKTGIAEIIGLVGDEVATSPFSGQMIKGAQDRAWEEGNTLMTVDTGGDVALETAAIETMLSHQVRGILYTAMYHRELEVPTGALETRTVTLNARDLSGRTPSVVPDEEQGGYEATRLLLEAGHTRIGMINIQPGEHIPAARDRRRGYERALTEAGIALDPALVRPGEGIHRTGREGALALRDLDDPVTAIFCGNDRTALGAYQGLEELGLRIPEDVSIVGFDDQDVLRDYFHPALTTMQLPFLAMGERAAELVLDSSAPAEVHALPCPVIHRGSVAPPKGR
ncbi:LacI family DNA-binding transcriptional regulator [Brachybacterium sp. YJGR34]|uniref:LacI family DNA-binding transcriptional regulator n=1 Tax=Brachybacterium sp. YJGR34 TaxID=2059911 RepID=UPI000E0AE787|nr:LacI family DNA-binding transcriptional regulator [Brachybacterium sp. YJGR34]